MAQNIQKSPIYVLYVFCLAIETNFELYFHSAILVPLSIAVFSSQFAGSES